MAKKPNPIVFKITDAGRLAVLDAQKQGLSVSLKTLVAGTSKYNASGKETRIKSEAMRADIVTSGVEKESKTLRFSATLNSTSLKAIHEVGLLTSDNKLFAIAASNEPLFTVYANVAFIGSFGLSLDDLDVSKITVSTDPDSAIVVKMMEDHLAASDPHPQYAKKDSLTQLDKKINKLGNNINGASGDLAKHIQDSNPHPQYALKKDHNAHVQAYESLKKQVEANKKSISDHASAKDPHNQYAKKEELNNHINAEDPHKQYLKESDVSEMEKEINELKKLLKNMGSSKAELPIGAILTTKKNYKDGVAVTKDLGYGVWKRIAEGMVLVGQSTKSNDPQWTKVVGNTFGDYKHKLTKDEMPKHKHGVLVAHEGGKRATLDFEGLFAINSPNNETTIEHKESEPDGSLMTGKGGNSMLSTGGDEPHNNVQPSYVVQHWERVS